MKYILTIALLLLFGCDKFGNKSVAQATPTPMPSPVASPSATPASVTAGGTAKGVHECTKGDEKHEFEISEKGDGCVLSVTESGKKSEPVKSVKGKKRCESAQKRMMDKLIAAGFKCH